MKLKGYLSSLLSILIFSVSSAMAQGLEGEARRKQIKDELREEMRHEVREALRQEVEGLGLQISGMMYINWHTNMTDSTDSESGNKKNTFEIERVYLTLCRRFSGIWRARITTDVGKERILENEAFEEQDISGETVKTVDGTVTSKYRLFIKYAFIEANQSIGLIDLRFQFGMIGTPVTGFTEKLSDQRWIHKNFINGSNAVLIYQSGSGLKGYSIDNSADMGASLDLSVMKAVTIAVAITNGEGYKKAQESDYAYPGDDSKNTAEGKAYYGRLTIRPVQSLYLSGYYRHEGTSVDEFESYRGYYGGGIAWKSDAVKIGVNYIKPFQKINGERWVIDNEELDMSIVDTWITLQFSSFTGIPLFIMACYGIGDTGQESGKTSFAGGGLGYKFNKHLRCIAWYEQTDSESLDEVGEPNPEKSFWLKAEVRL